MRGPKFRPARPAARRRCGRQRLLSPGGQCLRSATPDTERAADQNRDPILNVAHPADPSTKIERVQHSARQTLTRDRAEDVRVDCRGRVMGDTDEGVCAGVGPVKRREELEPGGAGTCCVGRGDRPRVGAWFTAANEDPERTWESRCVVVAPIPVEKFGWRGNSGGGLLEDTR